MDKCINNLYSKPGEQRYRTKDDNLKLNYLQFSENPEKQVFSVSTKAPNYFL